MKNVLQNGSALARLVMPFGPRITFAPDDGAGSGSDNNDDQGAGDNNDDGGSGDGSDSGRSKFEDAGLLGRRGNKDAGDDGNDDGNSSDKQGDDDGRPEGIPDKFWNADKKEIRVDGLAKAYATLETAHDKLKRDKGGASDVPESADDYFPDGLELGDDVDRLAIEGPDDPGLKSWAEVCKEHGIGKEVAVNIATQMMQKMNGFAPAPIDPDQEMEKLGKGGEAILDGVFTWLEGREKDGSMSERDADIAISLSNTADGINFLRNMRAMTGEAPIPLVPSTGQAGLSRDQWHEEFKQAVKDKDYKRQAELDELSSGVFGTGASHGGRSGGVNSEKTLTRGGSRS